MSIGGGSSQGLPRGSDIVKEGYLYIKRPPRNGIFRLKTWHRRYFVLRDECTWQARSLEMYLKEADFVKGLDRKFVLDLENVVHVGRTADSKRFRQTFIIVCLGRAPVLLADDDTLSFNSWLLAVSLIAEKGRTPHGDGPSLGLRTPGLLARRRSCELPDCLDGVPMNQYSMEMKMEEAVAERFDVSIQPTEASNRNDLFGDYQLLIRSWGVSLVRRGKDEYVAHWPLCYIRKYKNEMLGLSPKRKTTLVSLELGRRCVTGEGVIKFRTKQGLKIVTKISEAIATSRDRKMESSANQRYTCGLQCPGHFRGPWSKDSDSSSGGPLSPTDSRTLLDSRHDSWRSCRSGDSSDSTIHTSRTGDGSRLGNDLPPMTESRSSVNSSTSTESTESAEYIMASFTEKSNGLQILRPASSTSDIVRPLPLDDDEAQRLRKARAEAEGYLEVLPDYFEGEKESESRSNIYHHMDFSNNKREKSSSDVSSLLPLPVDSSGKRTPTSSRRKPPAPLPRPGHTIVSDIPPPPLPRPEHTMPDYGKDKPQDTIMETVLLPPPLSEGPTTH